MNKIVLTALLGVSAFFAQADTANATGTHYCWGKVTAIVTRASSEGTQVTIENMNGFARIGFGGELQSEMHKRQLAMLMLAQSLERPVQLEFLDSTIPCTADHNGALIRYVLMR